MAVPVDEASMVHLEEPPSSERAPTVSDLPITDGGCVPVFDCRVLVRRPDERGMVRARCANLADLTVEGRTERDALMAITRAFKTEIARHHSAGEPIPFLDPPLSPEADESERWLPVHL